MDDMLTHCQVLPLNTINRAPPSLLECSASSKSMDLDRSHLPRKRERLKRKRWPLFAAIFPSSTCETSLTSMGQFLLSAPSWGGGSHDVVVPPVSSSSLGLDHNDSLLTQCLILFLLTRINRNTLNTVTLFLSVPPHFFSRTNTATVSIGNISESLCVLSPEESTSEPGGAALTLSWGLCGAMETVGQCCPLQESSCHCLVEKSHFRMFCCSMSGVTFSRTCLSFKCRPFCHTNVS